MISYRSVADSCENPSSSVRVNLGSSLLVLKQGLKYKLNVHLRLNVFYYEPKLTRTELDVASWFQMVVFLGFELKLVHVGCIFLYLS
jgi:hypothetical protein